VTALLAGSSSRFRAARLLRIRMAISTFVMLSLSIACSICHATTSLIAITPTLREHPLSKDPKRSPDTHSTSSRGSGQAYEAIKVQETRVVVPKFEPERGRYPC
jgi:hypothetical protein